MTNKGLLRPVLRELIRDYDGEMMKVTIRKSNEPVVMTTDHELFVIRTKNCMQSSRETRLCQKRCRQHCPHKFFSDYKIEKIKAGELKISDYVLFPVDRATEDISAVKLADYTNRKLFRYGPRIAKLPNKIKLDNNFLKLIGYWIAEGSSHRAYIRFSLGDHESAFAEDIVKLSKKVFGFDAKICRRQKKNRTGTEITICNSNLANIFENLCGKGAANKHIPLGWECLPPKKQRILLEAIFRGDGFTSKGGQKSRAGYRSITTISRQLSWQIKNILLRQNIIPSIRSTKEKIDKKGVRHRPAYNIFWFEDPQATYADWWQDEKTDYAIYPVKKIERPHFIGKVYNLTVSGIHSYVTQNFAVGNCGKGGDIFSFMEEMEGLDFPEALKLLADRAGVKTDTYRNEIDKSQKNRILEINAKAAYFFHHFFLEMPASAGAREYLQKRGLKKETITAWQVGFISDQWNLLTGYLLKKGFSIDDLVASGLTIKRDGANAATGRGFYDRFRGRIMFPIWDTHNNVVGFTGRQLIENPEAGGKYVNTPETPVYDKSRVLYGLNKAKTEIKAKDLAVIVEGQMDVIACHQAGMTNVVASSGTALTAEQVKLIKRYSGNVAMAFDADNAGQEAMKRGVDVALVEGLNIKIINLPPEGGKDADECLKTNPAVWFKAVENAQAVMEWYFAMATKKFDKQNAKQKQAAANFLLAEIFKIPFAVEQGEWLKRLAEEWEVDQNLLKDELKKIKKYGKRSPAPEAPLKAPQHDRFELLLNEFWALILKFPKLFAAAASQARQEYFNGRRHQLLYETAQKQYNSLGHIDSALLSKELNIDGESPVDLLLLQAEKDFADFTESQALEEINKTITEIKKYWVKQRRLELTKELKQAKEAGDHNKELQLTKQIMELI